MNLLNDLRYGVRSLRKSPGFTAIAVITLAVGIGVTSAIYSVCDAMLWKPVALPQLETLVMLVERGQSGPDSWIELTPGDFEDIRRDVTVLEKTASWQSSLASINTTNGQPEGVSVALVSANFFDTVGVKPALGRAFETGEDQSGREFEAILSHRLWMTRFGGDHGIIGQTIRLDGKNYGIIGVMPDSFDFPLATGIWIPNALTPTDASSRLNNAVTGLARLKPGRTVEQASGELDNIGARLEASYGDTNKNRRFQVLTAHRFLVNNQREQYLVMLLSSALFVLLIACINVANLQFTRAQGRLREMGIRIALGASLRRMISQLLTESFLLSVPGAALGLVVAKWTMETIKAAMPPDLAILVHGWQDIQLDHRVLLFTLGAAVVSGILAGIVPAWQCSRPNLTGLLKEGGRTGSAGASRHVLRNMLVGAEVTLAVVLLVGAGLMVRGFRAQVSKGGGIEPSTLLVFQLAVTGDKYREPHQVADYYREVLNRISALPGVRSASAVTALPYSGHSNRSVFTIQGQVLEPDNKPRGMYQVASPSYFETLHVPLREGRLLAESDSRDAPKVALISQRLATRWFNNESALRKQIRIGDSNSKNPWLTVVGVVGDMMHSPYDKEPRPAFYVPYEQAPTERMDIAVRTVGNPLVLAPSITSAVRDIDRDQLISEIRTMEDAIYNRAIALNYMAVLMGVFGLLALGLSAIGVYGVMAHVVSEQTREIGIRIALGAQRQTVLAWMFRRAMVPISIGLLLGLTLAFGLSRLLASVIYGVPANDIATFIGVPATLIVAAILAIYVPAQRATRINPIIALRDE